MNGNNSKTLVWDNIPEWAIFALEYGTREELFLSDEDKKMITKFIAETFRTATPCRWIGSHTRNLTPIPLSGKHVRPTRSFS